MSRFSAWATPSERILTRVIRRFASFDVILKEFSLVHTGCDPDLAEWMATVEGEAYAISYLPTPSRALTRMRLI